MRPVVDPVSPLRKDPRGRAFDRLAGASVFMAALGARLYYLHQLRQTPLFGQLRLDPAYYVAWARRILEGDWLSGSRVFEQSPLYAYILAGIFRAGGENLLAPRLVQAVVGSLTCLLVFLIGRRAMGRAAGLAAGLLAALYAPGIFYDGMIMKTCWAVFLTAAMTAALVESEGSRRSLLFTAGICLGLAALVRDNLILLAPLLAIWLAADVRLRSALTRGRLREAAARAGVFAAGVILAVAPVTIRNAYVSGDWVLLTAGGGEVFFIGNNADADGMYSPPAFVRAMSGLEHEDFRKEAERRVGHALTRREASNYWLAEGARWIASDPLGWIRLTGRKLRIFLNGYELPDNQNFDHHRLFVPALRGLPTWSFLLPLAAAGIVLSAAAWRDLLPLWIVGGGYLATVLLFFNFARFRMPIVPVLMVFAGEAIAAAPGLLRPPLRRARTAAALGAALLALIVALVPVGQDALHRGQAESELADLLAQAGHMDQAGRASMKAIDLLESVYTDAGGTLRGEHGVAPPGAPGRVPLGDSYYGITMEAYQTQARIERMQGRENDAFEWAARAADAAPDSMVGRDALTAYAEALLARGRLAEAIAPVARARRIDPGAVRPALLQAQILHRTGHPREALRVVNETIDAHPKMSALDLADANYGLGLIYHDLGDIPRMRFHLREALEKNPNHPAAAHIRSLLAEADRKEGLLAGP